MRFFTVVISLTFLFGCQTAPKYSTEGLDENNSSFVMADSEHAHRILVGLNEMLFIMAVNGIKTGDYFNGSPESTRVAAGKVEIDVLYGQGHTTAEGCLAFEAKAGENYIIRKERIGRRVKFWIETEGSDQVTSWRCAN